MAAPLYDAERAALALASLQDARSWLAFAIPVSLNVLVNFVGWGVSSCSETDVAYDMLGAVAHVLSILASFFVSTNRSWRNALATAMVLLWAVRLGTFLFLRVLAAGGDRRLTKYLKRPLLFAIPWSMQCLWVLFNTLPLVIVNCGGTVAADVPLSALDAAAAAAWLAGVAIEAVADEQKRAFRATRGNRGRFIDTGLWAYSRHPNYFAEMLMWLSLAALCAPALFAIGGAAPAALLSPLFSIGLILFVSGVPLLEKLGQQKWGDDAAYRSYVAHTPLLVPWFPRRKPTSTLPQMA